MQVVHVARLRRMITRQRAPEADWMRSTTVGPFGRQRDVDAWVAEFWMDRLTTDWELRIEVVTDPHTALNVIGKTALTMGNFSSMRVLRSTGPSSLSYVDYE